MTSDAFRRRVQPKPPQKKCSQCKVHKALHGRPDERCQGCGKIYDDTQKQAQEHAARVEAQRKGQNGLGASNAKPPTSVPSSATKR